MSGKFRYFIIHGFVDDFIMGLTEIKPKKDISCFLLFVNYLYHLFTYVYLFMNSIIHLHFFRIIYVVFF